VLGRPGQLDGPWLGRAGPKLTFPDVLFHKPGRATVYFSVKNFLIIISLCVNS
jgi:hypothetical protein